MFSDYSVMTMKSSTCSCGELYSLLEAVMNDPLFIAYRLLSIAHAQKNHVIVIEMLSPFAQYLNVGHFDYTKHRQD